MGSGEDIVAGRVTTAESTTDLLGAIPSEQDVDFNGVVVLRVGAQPGTLRPKRTLDGIHGVGDNGSTPSRGGVGVVGFGGPNEGTGVVGQGGGLDGTGGAGVHGIGGDEGFFQGGFDGTAVPGAAMLGQGGRANDITNALRHSHGAGLVAIAGGTGQPFPPLTDTGSIGVYAQGAEAKVQTVPIDGQPTLVGPLAPGVGVLGRGGVLFPRDSQQVAAGVIGLAGDTPIPSFSETANSGVFGSGPVGVLGSASGSGDGVLGRSATGLGVAGETSTGSAISGRATDVDGRGGVFQSTHSAQVRLVPRNLISGSRLSPSAAIIPTSITVGKQEGPELPKAGRAGDLMAIIADATDQSTLWFCVLGGGGAAAARWAQVLLAQPYDGRA